jgi:predicted ArsR family transcriptional regulator
MNEPSENSDTWPAGGDVDTTLTSHLRQYALAAALGAIGGLGVNSVVDHRPDAWTATDACIQEYRIRAEMPPVATRERIHSLEEFLRKQGYEPPTHRWSLPVQPCSNLTFP